VKPCPGLHAVCALTRHAPTRDRPERIRQNGSCIINDSNINQSKRRRNGDHLSGFNRCALGGCVFRDCVFKGFDQAISRPFISAFKNLRSFTLQGVT
jgi:hypothetical protein